jgi:hypothetical protein
MLHMLALLDCRHSSASGRSRLKNFGRRLLWKSIWATQAPAQSTPSGKVRKLLSGGLGARVVPTCWFSCMCTIISACRFFRVAHCTCLRRSLGQRLSSNQSHHLILTFFQLPSLHGKWTCGQFQRIFAYCSIYHMQHIPRHGNQSTVGLPSCLARV